MEPAGTGRTIGRLESANGGEARESTARLLASALKLGNPRILAQGPESDAVRDEETRINFDSGGSGPRVHLDSETALAYDLVEERYGVDMHRLIEEAPTLFTLLAEASLAERRRRVGEAKAALEEFNCALPEHLAESDWAYKDEEESIERRDLFRHPGDLEWDDPRWEGYRKYGNPFANFLKKLANNIKADNGALDPADVEFDPDMVCRGYLFPERRARLTCGSRRAEWVLSHGYARLGQIPKRLRGEGEDVDRERVEWLEAQITDDEWAECEEMMAAAERLGKMLTGETEPDGEPGE
ncbi:MAG: hypothetical protein J4F48_13140 [Nitrospinae bacterium]|nr:hypothetical protein [Nitrospinota bacterium]